MNILHQSLDFNEHLEQVGWDKRKLKVARLGRCGLLGNVLINTLSIPSIDELRLHKEIANGRNPVPLHDVARRDVIDLLHQVPHDACHGLAVKGRRRSKPTASKRVSPADLDFNRRLGNLGRVQDSSLQSVNVAGK